MMNNISEPLAVCNAQCRSTQGSKRHPICTDASQGFQPPNSFPHMTPFIMTSSYYPYSNTSFLISRPCGFVRPRLLSVLRADRDAASYLLFGVLVGIVLSMRREENCPSYRTLVSMLRIFGDMLLRKHFGCCYEYRVREYLTI